MQPHRLQRPFMVHSRVTTSIIVMGIISSRLKPMVPYQIDHCDRDHITQATRKHAEPSPRSSVIVCSSSYSLIILHWSTRGWPYDQTISMYRRPAIPQPIEAENFVLSRNTHTHWVVKFLCRGQLILARSDQTASSVRARSEKTCADANPSGFESLEIA